MKAGEIALVIAVLFAVAMVFSVSVAGMAGAFDQPATDDGCSVVAEFCDADR